MPSIGELKPAEIFPTVADAEVLEVDVDDKEEMSCAVMEIIGATIGALVVWLDGSEADVVEENWDI